MSEDDGATTQDGAGAAGAPTTPGPYSVLPEPIRLEDTVAGQEVTPARDPSAGRDTENEFMLRHM